MVIAVFDECCRASLSLTNAAEPLRWCAVVGSKELDTAHSGLLQVAKARAVVVCANLACKKPRVPTPG